MAAQIKIHEEVRDALEEGRAVVALETAVTTHGLPREALDLEPRILMEDSDAAANARRHAFGTEEPPYEWNESNPVNLELARAMSATVRAMGAVPASTAVIDGTLRIGLEPDEVERLASEQVAKCSTRDLSVTMARGETGGTTVAGTLAAIQGGNHQLGSRGSEGIRIMATGGIGGVHRGWQEHRDVSADIRALATTPALVICAGAKVILDIAATREALDSNMVTILGWHTDRFPRFTAPGSADEPGIDRVEDPLEIAATCNLHWNTLDRNEGILVVNEIDEHLGLDAKELESLVDSAVEEAAGRGVTGPDLTPYLLSTLASATEGRALDANIAVLLGNASLAALLGNAMHGAPGDDIHMG